MVLQGGVPDTRLEWPHGPLQEAPKEKGEVDEEEAGAPGGEGGGWRGYQDYGGGLKLGNQLETTLCLCLKFYLSNFEVKNRQQLAL